jgi:polysaccharide deacetylase family protein (PEP-CTERM system associated)
METHLQIAADQKPNTTPDVFTIDVEDWFHILEATGTPDIAAWDLLESRLERNLKVLLDLLAAFNVKSTCFALGWVAARTPQLLREAAEHGHEIASHGYGHQVVSRLSRCEFREDIRAAKAAIEDAVGRPVHGYRAPGFSITQETPWAFDEIAEAGYTFDSSVFPARHGHGGMPDAPRRPYFMQTSAGRLVEFPVSIADTPLGPQCLFGGGYLRLYPMWLIRALAKQVRADGRGVIWYIHPREIDPDHPRVQMPIQRRLKSYVNLRGTHEKLQAILRAGRFSTLSDLAAQMTKAEQAFMS